MMQVDGVKTDQEYLDLVEKEINGEITLEEMERMILKQYPLWIRDIWHKPDKSVPWTFWQYTSRGRPQGFSKNPSYFLLYKPSFPCYNLFILERSHLFSYANSAVFFRTIQN